MAARRPRTPPGGNAGGTSLQDVAPVVTAIQCEEVGPDGQVGLGQNLVDADSVVFSVAFNKSVTGVTPSDFAVDGNGVTGTVASVSGSGFQYTVTVSGVTGSGTLGLTIPRRQHDRRSVRHALGPNHDSRRSAVYDQQAALLGPVRQVPRQAARAIGTRAEIWQVGGLTGPLQGWCDGSDVFLGGTPATISIAQSGGGLFDHRSLRRLLIEGNADHSGLPRKRRSTWPSVIVIDCNLVGSPGQERRRHARLGGTEFVRLLHDRQRGMLQFQDGAELPAGTALAVDGGIRGPGRRCNAGP